MTKQRNEEPSVIWTKHLKKPSKEYNEFIVYWAPLMKNNPYNFIHFAGAEYDEMAKLTITPEPDSILRVFMVFSPLNRKIEVTPQEIIPFEREGFTVVEWGGTVINYALRK